MKKFFYPYSDQPAGRYKNQGTRTNIPAHGPVTPAHGHTQNRLHVLAHTDRHDHRHAYRQRPRREKLAAGALAALIYAYGLYPLPSQAGMFFNFLKPHKTDQQDITPDNNNGDNAAHKADSNTVNPPADDHNPAANIMVVPDNNKKTVGKDSKKENKNKPNKNKPTAKQAGDSKASNNMSNEADDEASHIPTPILHRAWFLRPEISFTFLPAAFSLDQKLSFGMGGSLATGYHLPLGGATDNSNGNLDLLLTAGIFVPQLTNSIINSGQPIDGLSTNSSLNGSLAADNAAPPYKHNEMLAVRTVVDSTTSSWVINVSQSASWNPDISDSGIINGQHLYRVSTSSSSSNGTALVAQQNYIDRTSTTMWNGSMVSGGQSISATPSVWSATSTEILSTSAIDGVINATLSAMPTLGTISRSETQLIFTYTKSGTVDVVTSANMTMTDIHTVALVSGGQIKANEPTTLYYKPDNVSQPAFWQPLTPIDQQYLVISNPQDLKVIGNTAIMTLTQDVAQLQNIIISRSRSVDISQVIGVGVSETATIAAQGVVISTSAAQTQTITTKNYQASMVPTRTIIKDQQFYIPITIGVDYSLPPLGKQFTMTVGVEGGAWVHNIDRQYQRNQTAPQYYTGNITTINFQQNSNSFRVTDINTATSRQQQLLLASGSISQLENQQQTASTSITYRANQAAVETTVIGSNFSRIYDINVGTAPAVIGIANLAVAGGSIQTNGGTASLTTVAKLGGGLVGSGLAVTTHSLFYVDVSDAHLATTPNPTTGIFTLINEGAFISSTRNFGYSSSSDDWFDKGVNFSDLNTITVYCVRKRNDFDNIFSNCYMQLPSGHVYYTTNALTPVRNKTWDLYAPTVSALQSVTTIGLLGVSPVPALEFFAYGYNGGGLNATIPSAASITNGTMLDPILAAKTDLMTLRQALAGALTTTTTVGTRSVIADVTIITQVTSGLTMAVSSLANLSFSQHVTVSNSNQPVSVTMTGTNTTPLVITVDAPLANNSAITSQSSSVAISGTEAATVTSNSLYRDQAVQVRGVIIPKVSFDWSPTDNLTFSVGGKLYLVFSGYSDYYSAAARAEASALGIDYKKDQLLWYGGVNVGANFRF